MVKKRNSSSNNLKIRSILKNLKPINSKKKIEFCKQCVISNQRPRILFNEEGICGPCLYAECKKTLIDWDKRERELEILCDKHRSKDGSWDVVVPGSGGKDSSFVAYMLKKKYGMHPLTVTWGSALPTDIGRQNLDNFILSGYDNILGSPNGEVHRKLTKLGLTQFGDNFLSFIYGQINFPYQIATKYKIKLIFFGEDGEVEYGGSLERFDKPKLDTEYTVRTKFTSFGPKHWKSYGIKEHELQAYLPPTPREMKTVGVEAHYFSYYDNWKPDKHYKIAKKQFGFKPNPDGRSEGTYTDFASLDDKTDGVHYYLALIKFGIARTTSDASHQIRDGVITRDEGVDLVRKYDSEFPRKYMKEFLDYMQMNRTQFDRVIDKFRRPIIWKKDDKQWKLRQQVKKLN